MISGTVVAVLTLLLAIVLRYRRFAHLKMLVLPLILCSIAAMTRSLSAFLSDNSALDWWSLVALVLTLGFLASRTGLLLLFDFVLGRRMGVSVPQLVRDVTAIAIYLTVGIILLNTLGIRVTGLIATSAVLTVVVGLAFQQTLGNLLAGLALAWEQRLPTGFWIDFDDELVCIEESGWRSIILKSRLGERILVPNADIAASKLVLLGKGEQIVAIPIRLGLSYSIPPDAAKALFRCIAGDMELVLRDPEPKILTVEFADSSILYECRLWTRAPWQKNEIIDIFLTRAYAALKRQGMEIPFPQLTIHRGRSEQTTQIEYRLEGLSEARLFAGLPKEALETVARTCRLLRFAPGETVIRQGEESNALFILISGEAVVSHSGKEISRIGPREVFGEGAFLTGNPRTATVRAGEKALEILEIGKKSLGTVLEEHPEVLSKLAERLAERKLEGETIRDASGAIVHPHGLVAQLKRTLARLVGA